MIPKDRLVGCHNTKLCPKKKLPGFGGMLPHNVSSTRKGWTFQPSVLLWTAAPHSSPWNFQGRDHRCRRRSQTCPPLLSLRNCERTSHWFTAAFVRHICWHVSREKAVEQKEHAWEMMARMEIQNHLLLDQKDNNLPLEISHAWMYNSTIHNHI